MKKFFKKVRRDLARFILGFERCPCCYRRNFWAELKLAATVMAMGTLGAGMVILFFLLA